MAGLLHLIRDNKDVRSIFGKKELEIIEKQLLGIRLKPSEITRLSRDIRKKLDIIKKLSEFKEEFQLKKGFEIKLIIQESMDIILNSKFKQKISKIILFGSAAENKLNFRSDIDIAIVFDKIDIKEATQFRIFVSGRVKDKIDVQVYNVLDEKIKREIDKKGRILFKA